MAVRVVPVAALIYKTVGKRLELMGARHPVSEADWAVSRELVYTRKIMTSVDLIRAAATCPFSNRISRTASEVITEVIC